MSPRNNKRLLSAACLCGLAAAGSAWALKTDKGQPINVHSDHGDFQADPKNANNATGIYTGHVIITQGSIVITADKAVLHLIDNQLDTADITGNPATFIQQPDQGQPMHGQALEITYDAPKNEIVLITKAKLTQQILQLSGDADKVAVPGQRLMTAERIRYNTDTQHVIAKAGDEDQRVHISFPAKVAPPTVTTPGPVKTPGSATRAKPASARPPAVMMPRISTAPAPATTPAPDADTGAP
ncbi:MAG TPA: lipopolysaccharide transport periplasmic protein LptA [Gammaproteobacteria bacterium]|jgi:lipopolysaccharide export system protein LptA